MQAFRVKFWNRLVGSNGHQFKCLQRMIPIRHAKTSDRAVCAARRRFEKAEHISDWRHHAQLIEVEKAD